MVSTGALSRPAAAAAAVPVQEDGATILLVEDDPSSAALATALLRAALPAVNVVHVGTVTRAEAALRRARVACVLLDLSLPDSQGVGSVARLLAIRPDATIVVMTGRDDEDAAREALALGAQDYVVKSRSLETSLARSVTYALERTAHRDALAVAEERVRAAERARGEQLVLLRDRQRIAADLHDLVIQRLFATGLGLSAALRAPAVDPVPRIEEAIAGIDHAIVELRGAIHHLKHDPQSSELVSGVNTIVHNAARATGLTPTIEFRGSLADVDPALWNDIAAVLSEAVSNVARHAQAKHIDVTVSALPDVLTLRIADDGVGVGVPGRRSGLDNMRSRAERRGGSFACVPAEASGTVVEWRVPTALASTSPPSGEASGRDG